jgi:hypothetical protein
LRLQPLFLLRGSPESARYGCHFYNRTEGNEVRLVSYHQVEESEFTGPMDDVLEAVHELSNPIG